MYTIICIENQEIYTSLAEAARFCGGTPNALYNCIKYESGYYQGYHFEFYKGPGRNTTAEQLQTKIDREKEIRDEEEWEEFVQGIFQTMLKYGNRKNIKFEDVYAKFIERTKGRFE